MEWIRCSDRLPEEDRLLLTCKCSISETGISEFGFDYGRYIEYDHKRFDCASDVFDPESEFYECYWIYITDIPKPKYKKRKTNVRHT